MTRKIAKRYIPELPRSYARTPFIDGNFRPWKGGCEAVMWNDLGRGGMASPRRGGPVRGNDIVQEGGNDAGATLRWSFTEITPDFVPLARRTLDRRRSEL